MLIFYTEVLCNRHFVAFAVLHRGHIVKLMSFELFSINLSTKPMQMSVNDYEKVHLAYLYVVLCVQIMEREDRNYFGLTVSALKLE